MLISKNTKRVMCLKLFFACMSLSVGAETLADVDADIQSGNITPARIPGQAAYNVYTDVTKSPNSFLERKIAILKAAGITNFASSGSYGNFYSFTGQKGYTDTKIDIITPQTSTRLYRRGTTGRQETQSYLGSWWSGSYLGTEATRNGQAVLSSWGSDLKRIYVIDVPTGTTLVGGLASPMEQNGEYRSGGAYQYYYRGVPRSWLVYALYAPDYLKSYSVAITGGQRLGRSALEDIGSHLEELRYAKEEKAASALKIDAQNGFWVKYYQGNSTITGTEKLTDSFKGMHFGWDKLIDDSEKGRRYLGFLLGQGTMDQNVAVSNVKSNSKHTYGGLYFLSRFSDSLACTDFSSAVLLYGRLNVDNQVPGESGYGLNQKYAGNMLSASFEKGLIIRKAKGWFVEPHLELMYTKVLQHEFDDNLGAHVAVQNNESLFGGLGLMVLRKCETSAGKHSKVWAKVSYLHEFCGSNKVDVSGDQNLSSGGRNVMQLKLGAAAQLSHRFSVSADITRVFGDEHGYRGGVLLKSLF